MRTTCLLLTVLALGAFQGRPQRAPELQVGDNAPDFTIKWLDQDKSFKLSDNFGKRPTVLIFGSYT